MGSKKRKAFVVFLALGCILFVLPRVYAQSGDYEVDGWKMRFASPTYGVSLATLVLTYPENDQYDEAEETLVVPGFEVRIYNGINVAPRGGFYTGYEVGATFYTLGESYSYSVFQGGTTYQDYHISDLFCGMIFVMSKYGYRVDLGTDEGGMSIGPQIGIGVAMGGGSVEIVNDETGESFSGDTDMIFGPMLEADIEAAFRFGRNFRVVGAIGASVSPMLEWDNESDTDAIEGEFLPVRPTIRLGFALNY
jgi:hypothetical protein